MNADRHVVLSDGLRISYAEAGDADGPAVLYLHGTPGSRMQIGDPLDAVAADLGLRLIAPDRPGYGGSSFVRYRVVDYPMMLRRFADALGIGEFGVVGTSGGGRYACACAAVLGTRVRQVALVASTAPIDLPGVRQAWSEQDRRLYTMAARAPWLLRLTLARTVRRLRHDPGRMLDLLPAMSAPDAHAVTRSDVQHLIRGTTTEAFRQGGRALVHDLRLEALPWGLRLDAITTPVDVWHGRDDTIVRSEQAERLIAALPAARSRLIPGEGHVSLTMLRSSDYLQPFR